MPIAHHRAYRTLSNRHAYLIFTRFLLNRAVRHGSEPPMLVQLSDFGYLRE
jgi:hypothetical protein